jgi:hypothetical protein
VAEHDPPIAPDAAPALPHDNSRDLMMSREAGLPLAERIELFEALSRDAGWARNAVRTR